MNAGETFRQEWPRPSRQRPIAVIGAGAIVLRAHVPAYRGAGFEVAGFFDVDPGASAAAAREAGGRPIFHSLEEACAVPGAVFDVTVPPDQITAILRAIPPRSAVLIQKPMGRDLDEATRILALCRERELIAAVNFQLRFSPNVLALCDAIERGLLGAVADVDARVVTHTSWGQWSFLAGAPRLEVLYHSIHYLDLVRSFLGEPRSVRSLAAPHPEFAAHADTRSTTILEFESGARAVVHTNHAHVFGRRHRASEIAVEGDRGAAVLRLGVNLAYPEGEPDSLEVATRGGEWRDVALRGSWFPHAFAGPMSNLQRFAAGEDSRLLTDVEDALRTMALVEACYASSAAGGTAIPDPSSEARP
jgi:predicted dehydrogenase